MRSSRERLDGHRWIVRDDASAHVAVLLEVALAALERGAFEEARRVAAAAAALADGCGSAAAAAEAHGFAARVAHAAAAFDEALQHFVAMRTALRRIGDDRGVLIAELALAFVAYDTGDGARARAMLDELEARHDAALEPLRGRLVGYRGNLARQQGNHDAARAQYATAIRTCAAAGDDAFVHVFAMDDAVAGLLAGDLDRSLATLVALAQRSRALPRGILRTLTVAIIEHYVAIGSVLVGIEPLTSGGGAVMPSLDETRRAARAPTLQTLRALAPATEHGRLTATLLLRLTSSASIPRVLVASDGSKFIQGSHVIVLTRRLALRRIVAALVHAKAPLSVAELVAAGWPGERIQTSAARNRTHVALTTLRRLGLEGVLRQTPQGYVLDAERVTVIGRS
jgi:predicted negative regulator of RcsB-dependent stress response